MAKMASLDAEQYDVPVEVLLEQDAQDFGTAE